MSQNLNTNNIVVTGAAGFIGGMTCIELKRKGYNVFGIDRRYFPHLKNYYDEFVNTDIIDYEAFLLIKRYKPAAIIHCAGTSLVGPSMKNPGLYFDNNVGRTVRLLDFIKNEVPETKFIFSSSASVYGNVRADACREYMDPSPLSPYAESKYMVEKILDWYAHAYNLRYAALRYFNACGADSESAHGQEPNATHIFAKLFDAALKDDVFTLNGSTYPTKDGTCIRDYIHVSDIADAHIKAIDKSVHGIYNLGCFKGTTNLECIHYVETRLKRKIVVNKGPAREGDSVSVIADPSKFQIATNWKAWRTIPMIVDHLAKWYETDTYKSLTKRS